MVINGDRLLLASPIKDMLLQKVRMHGVSHGLAEVGYDIRIKQDIRFIGGATPRISVLHPDRSIPEPMEYGHFCLASAMEEFIMPPDLVGVVHDKSTWARRGLSVFNTVIEPGWRGFLTLELVYHGGTDLHIPAGAGIAQVLFHQISEPAQYEGKYQNQEDCPVSAKLS